MRPAEEIERFIRRRLHLRPAPGVPEIHLYQGHPGSGLRRFLGEASPPPYWAYGWAGGAVLARYILDNPDVIKGKRVLDLGSGSGIVAIACAKAGAAHVLAVDIDPVAVIAARLNAQENLSVIEVRARDVLHDPPPEADLVLAGDVFYDEHLSARVSAFLSQCRTAGVQSLVGDPRRRYLPGHQLTERGRYRVPDFGGDALTEAVVYEYGVAEKDVSG